MLLNAYTCFNEELLTCTLENVLLVRTDTGKLHSSYIGMNVCGSAYENGCVVDGMSHNVCYSSGLSIIIIIILMERFHSIT